MYPQSDGLASLMVFAKLKHISLFHFLSSRVEVGSSEAMPSEQFWNSLPHDKAAGKTSIAAHESYSRHGVRRAAFYVPL